MNLVQMTDEIVTLGSAVGHTSGCLGGGKGVKGKNSTFNKTRREEGMVEVKVLLLLRRLQSHNHRR
jgi:hypothetical protein